METYHTKIPRLTGTDYKEISRKARRVYKNISSQSKRKPYLRSVYFNKEKVFLDYFWQHLQEKNWRDRTRRLQFYPCALDLIKNTRVHPTSKINPNNSSEKLHRFLGITSGKETFAVQIKESMERKEKHFIAVFPFE